MLTISRSRSELRNPCGRGYRDPLSPSIPRKFEAQELRFASKGIFHSKERRQPPWQPKAPSTPNFCESSSPIYAPRAWSHLIFAAPVQERTGERKGKFICRI